MDARVKVELISPPIEADIEDMFASAKYLTNDEKRVVGKAEQSRNQ